MKDSIQIDLTAASTELGQAVERELAKTGGSPVRSGKERRVLLNIQGQPPNTLLHDGREWQRHTPSRLVGDTRRLLRDAGRGKAGFIVHASYAFLRAAEAGARVGERLRPIVDAALEAEQLILDNPIPAAVLRLGYLYGPLSVDLKAYRNAFRFLRPYWAGPASQLHDHLHHDDAARALVAVSRLQPAGRVLYATDRTPVSFSVFMDHFARLVGNPLPAHLPRLSRSLAHMVVAEEHMQMVEMGVSGAASPVLPRFSPGFPDYRDGLADVLRAWKQSPARGAASGHR